MERRRIQEVGGGTVTVSLPAPWAKEHTVSAGTEVRLYPHLDGSLVLRVSEPQERVSGTIELDDEDPETVADLVRAAVGTGYKRVTVTVTESFSAAHYRAVLEAVGELAGVDIVEESTDQIVIAELLDTGEISIRQLMLHLQYAVDSIHERTLGLLETGSGVIEPIVDRNEESTRRVRQLDRLFTRALSDPETMDALGSSRHRLYHFIRIARLLQRVGNHLRELATILARFDPTLDDRDRLHPLLEDAGLAIGDSVEAAVSQSSIKTARAVLAESSIVQKRVSELGSELAGGTGKIMQWTIHRHITTIAKCANQIATIALRMKFADRKESGRLTGTDGKQEKTNRASSSESTMATPPQEGFDDE